MAKQSLIPNFSFDTTFIPNDVEILVLRPIYFFHAEQVITMGKLREYFTEKAIIKFYGDDFIKTK